MSYFTVYSRTIYNYNKVMGSNPEPLDSGSTYVVSVTAEGGGQKTMLEAYSLKESMFYLKGRPVLNMELWAQGCSFLVVDRALGNILMHRVRRC